MGQKLETFDFNSFLDECGSDFYDYLDRASLPDEENEHYCELNREILELHEKYPKVMSVIAKDKAYGLTEEESTAMIQILEDEEELYLARLKNVYFKGCADSINYLRKLKLIKPTTE